MTDIRTWAYKSVDEMVYNWAKAYCFTGGKLVGMFLNEKEKRPYVVGSILDNWRLYDDQVYQMSGTGNASVQILPVVSYCSLKSGIFNK